MLDVLDCDGVAILRPLGAQAVGGASQRLQVYMTFWRCPTRGPPLVGHWPGKDCVRDKQTDRTAGQCFVFCGELLTQLMLGCAFVFAITGSRAWPTCSFRCRHPDLLTSRADTLACCWLDLVHVQDPYMHAITHTTARTNTCSQPHPRTPRTRHSQHRQATTLTQPRTSTHPHAHACTRTHAHPQTHFDH